MRIIKLISLCFILSWLILTLIYIRKDKLKTQILTNNITQKKEFVKPKTQTPKIEQINSSIFIPYWNIPNTAKDVEKYDTLIYFGVSPDISGNMNNDLGFMNIDKFVNNTDPKKKRLLTVRMLDTDTNLAILENASSQLLVISQTLELVEKYGFDGVVLDLEVGVLSTDSVRKQITDFAEEFSSQAQTSDQEFYMTIYGDTFYRARPYDVKKLATFIDGFYVMAYDFHKSRGEPGPNFPFGSPPDGGSLRASPSDSLRASQHDYSFQTMISDFSSVVPQEKITVLFGMYGYDWTLGAQGKPLKSATAISLTEIEHDILPNCKVISINFKNSLDTIFAHVVTLKGPTTLIRKKVFSRIEDVYASDGYSNCEVVEDNDSHEKNIKYTDDEGYSHELWYEDEESVNVKIEYLKKQGVGNVGYWVWGYF